MLRWGVLGPVSSLLLFLFLDPWSDTVMVSDVAVDLAGDALACTIGECLILSDTGAEKQFDQ